MMDRKDMIFGGMLVLILIAISMIYVNQGACCQGAAAERAVYRLVSYGENETAVAEELDDGSYRLTDGTRLGSGDVKVLQKYEDQQGLFCCPMDPVCGADGRTYLSICGAALANVRVAYAGICDGECEPCDGCVEPEPELRFVCANGKIVKNKIDCGGDEDCAYVVDVYYICPDGNKVDDPAECEVPTQTATTAYVPPNIQTVYECSDGRTVGSAADCSANCGQPVGTAAAYVPDTQGYGGAVDTVYECWDGSIVSNPSDCPLYCEDPCDCGDEYNPVCVDGQTYRNPCYARCDGKEKYREGECEQPCAESGERCTPVGSTATAPLTHLPGIAVSQYPTCCVQGTYCSPDGYCVPDVDQCEQVGGRCYKDEDCCEELVCGPNMVCEKPEECKDEGEVCGYYGYVTGAAAPQTFLGTCCEGLECIDNLCTEEPCAPEYYNCRTDEDCCEGLYCSDFGQCRKPCLQLGAACKASIECCSGYCIDNVCRAQECSEERQFCRDPDDTTYGPEYDCCEGYVCEGNSCVPAQTDLCSGPSSPEWNAAESCATGNYDGVWGTYCGFCGDDNKEYRYYCVVEYSYGVTGAPVETPTDEVALASITCPRGCSGTMCK